MGVSLIVCVLVVFCYFSRLVLVWIWGERYEEGILVWSFMCWLWVIDLCFVIFRIGLRRL
jgi:hypothetical protein